MKRPKTGLIIIDLIILSGAYVFMAGLKPVMVSYLSPRYLIGFGITVFLWIFSSFYFRKYNISRKENPAFLVYFGVLVMGGVAAWIARLKARGMAEASFAMAVVLAVMAGTQLLLSGAPAGADRNQAIGRAVCVALFAASGLLFRRASLAGVK